MKKWIFLSTLILLAGVSSAGLATDDDQEQRAMRFGPLPMESRDRVTRQFLAFVDFLEKGLQQPVEMLYHQSYETLLSEFSQGQIDLVYLGPLPYVVLEERMPSAIPVVRFLGSDGSASYSCSIIRFLDRNLDLASTEKKRVALTQPLSTCGYLGVETLLQRHGESLESPQFDYDYVGSHEQVALEIILGNYDIGGIKTAIGEKYRPLGVVPVAETGPMPGFLLVANGDTLNKEEIERIKRLLLELDPLHDEQDRAITRAWGPSIRHGVIAVEDEDYMAVREAWKRRKSDLGLEP